MTDVDAGAFLMPFGKHKGKSLSEIPRGYLTWALAKAFLRPETRAALKAYVDGADSAPTARPRRARRAKPSSPQEETTVATCARCGTAGTAERPLVHADCEEVPF